MIDAGELINRNSIAGVVILYNSPSDCFENIRTYLTQVSKLYVIDNSPTTSQWVIDKLISQPAIHYSHFSQNVGIATALNAAARQAIQDGYRYLLTMDDDSRTPVDMVQEMAHYLAANQPKTIGIISPRHILSATVPEKRNPIREQAVEVLTTMTSGNLVNLAAYEQVGPFYDELFIDVVDHDFDLRLKATGYRIVELPGLYLVHRLGTPKRISLLPLTFVSHSPVRNYYLIRNSMVVARRQWHNFPSYSLTAAQTILLEIGKIALLEDQKLVRLRLAIKAIRDAIRNQLGPIRTQKSLDRGI